MSREEYKDAIEVSVIFHEGQRMFAVPKQPAQQEPVGEVNRYGLDSHGRKWHGIHWYDPNVDVPHGTKLYTSPPAQSLPFGVGGGLVAIKTLLSRDPRVHANTAIQMIDAILAEQPEEDLYDLAVRADNGGQP